MTAQEVETGLRQFSGSEEVYRDPLFRDLVYSEGFRWLMNAAGTHWLLGEIWGAWREAPAIREDPIVFWKLRVAPDHSAVLECVHDTDGPVYWTKAIEYTDFPLPELTLYLAHGEHGPVLMTPGEY